MSERYRSALLLGQDHSELGGIAIDEVTPRISIAISRGRFPKPYAYVDPNEDAVFALTDGTTTVLAVADGHNGFDAARTAIHAVELVAPDVLAAPAQKATALLAEAAVTSVNDSLPPTRVDSRTALTVVVISNGALAAATFGDTVCFVVTRRDIERVGRSIGAAMPKRSFVWHSKEAPGTMSQSQFSGRDHLRWGYPAPLA